MDKCNLNFFLSRPLFTRRKGNRDRSHIIQIDLAMWPRVILNLLYHRLA